MSKYRFEEIAINRTEKKKPVESDKYTYLGLEHLDSGTLKVSRFGSEVAPIGEKLVMKKGDVLFGKRRAYQKKVAIAPFDGIFSAHGMVLRPKTEVIDSEFFPLFISSDYFLDAAIKISVGSLSPTINWKDLKNLEFDLPNLETQRKLAKVLWALIDTIENYRVLLAKTDELVKSQFIDQFGNDKAERIQLKSISLEWMKGQAFKKDDIVDGGQTKCIHYGELFTSYGSVINVVKSRTNAAPIRMSKKGDILFPASDVTPLGLTKCSAIMLDDVLLGGDIIVMRPIAGVNSEYLSFAIRMQKEQLLSRVTGAVVRHISGKSLQTVSVPLPNIEKQNQFVDIIRQSDKSKFELENCMKNAVSMYKKILKEYLG